jgi:hypothetical protein
MAEAVVGNVRVMVGQWSNCPRGSELGKVEMCGVEVIGGGRWE